MKQCSTCKSNNPRRAVFCENCGAMLQETIEEARTNHTIEEPSILATHPKKANDFKYRRNRRLTFTSFCLTFASFMVLTGYVFGIAFAGDPSILNGLNGLIHFFLILIGLGTLGLLFLSGEFRGAINDLYNYDGRVLANSLRVLGIASFVGALALSLSVLIYYLHQVIKHKRSDKKGGLIYSLVIAALALIGLIIQFII